MTVLRTPNHFPKRWTWLVFVLLWCSIGTLDAAEKNSNTNSRAASTSTTAVAPAPSTVPDTAATDDTALDAKGQAQSQIENSMANIEIIQQTLESLRTELDNSKEDALMNRSSLGTIKDGLELIDSKLKEAYSGLDESRNNIASNTADIAKLKTDLLNLSRDVRTNASDIYSQKSLIEGNATRLYEILISIADLTKRLEDLQGQSSSIAEQKQAAQNSLAQDLNRLWLLLAVVLVFLTPLAFVLTSSRENFKPLPDGTPQHQGVLLVCLAVFLGYFTVGFGLMFGTSAQGWVGLSSFWLSPASSEPGQAPAFPFADFALYQTGFVMLAALIVYSAVGRQLSATSHLLLALFVSVIVIPIFGHWAWSGMFLPGNKGWLEAVGFVDSAGSTTINAVAGWFAFFMVWKLGQQTRDPIMHDKTAQEAPYSASAVLFLWLGWLGFNTGLLPLSNHQIAPTMLNVALAAAMAGSVSFLHHAFFHTGKGMIERALGGFVTGLVAVSASANVVSIPEALVLGAMAGLLHNSAFTLLQRYFLPYALQTRAAYLVAIHGVGGIWGSLAVAMLGTEGTFSMPNMTQLLNQVEGIVVAVIYSAVLANVALWLLSLRKKRKAVAA